MPGVQSSLTRNSHLASRIAAALVLMPLTVGLTWAGGIYFTVLIAGCAVLLAREWSRLCGARPESLPAVGLGIGSAAIIGLAYLHPDYALAAVACIVLYFVLRRLPASQMPKPNRVWLAAGALVIPTAGLTLIWLRTMPENGLFLVVWLFAVVWAADIAAFATGKTVGGPRLAPSISPNKTWSGFGGGLAGASIVGFCLSYAIAGEAILLALIAGMLVGLASAVGDIFESYLKRRFDAKDSGGLIPGHGGVLDRLDSLLAAAPATLFLYSLDWRWL